MSRKRNRWRAGVGLECGDNNPAASNATLRPLWGCKDARTAAKQGRFESCVVSHPSSFSVLSARLPRLPLTRPSNSPDSMAQKARKDRAKSNSAALNNLHIGSLVVNGLFLLLHFVFRSRSLLLWFLLSLPGFVCQFILDRTGRPSYDPDTKALKSSGEDLAAAGLTEYMFDVVWVTWAAAILVAFLGNWAWSFWVVVPAYGAYKAYGMMGAAKQMAQLGSNANAGPAPAGNRKQRRAA